MWIEKIIIEIHITNKHKQKKKQITKKKKEKNQIQAYIRFNLDSANS